MWMVQWITVVLMIVEFAHVLPMSLVINVMHVQLVGMVSQPVKVSCIIKLSLNHFLLSLKMSSECLCDVDGSVDNSCTDDGGVCTCIANVSGDKCDVCTTGWYGFPTCQGEIYY